MGSKATITPGFQEPDFRGRRYQAEKARDKALDTIFKGMRTTTTTTTTTSGPSDTLTMEKLNEAMQLMAAYPPGLPPAYLIDPYGMSGTVSGRMTYGYNGPAASLAEACRVEANRAAAIPPPPKPERDQAAMQSGFVKPSWMDGDERNTHYGDGISPAKGRESARSMARSIERYCDGYYIVLAFRGMSGVTLATRISEAFISQGVKHGMVYVRKPGERSHGHQVEKALNYDHGKPPMIVFVDDFVSSGATRDATLKALVEAGLWTPHYVCATQRDVDKPREWRA